VFFTTSWDWTLYDETRKFSRRYFDRAKRMPTEVQAANYSATKNYLKAVQAVQSTSAHKVMDYLKKTELEDFYAKGYIRADGRYLHDMYLAQVMSPSESKAPGDYVKLIGTMPGPGEEVFARKSESRCAWWK
jgi:branched-chain amino acid transport system substrate-binding protein